MIKARFLPRFLVASFLSIAMSWQSAMAATMTPPEAARLLNQATFGANQADLDKAITMTAESWVDQQIVASGGWFHQNSCNTSNKNPSTGKVDLYSRAYTWWRVSLYAPDQLRQRVAYALSQILVVSEKNSLFSNDGGAEGLCMYNDILVRNAFGNYRTLLEKVTLSSQMGVYLSMLSNDKPDATTGRRADENYAREFMQLFTIGLTKLNLDGSNQLDANGVPIPAYTQDDVENLARVFTGWSWANSSWANGNPLQFLQPMKAFDDHHDKNAKIIVGGVSIPANGSTTQDLKLALDAIFRHPNVGPFVSKQLIQKLVTSNPSPAYVARVATIFNNDGKNVRGNMAAVIKAILLDPEAVNGVAENPNFGKAREPLLRQTHLWRLLKALPASSDNRYQYNSYNMNAEQGQAPLAADSVFNFYQPDYAPAGEIRDSGLVAPELQLTTDPGVAGALNRIYVSIYYDYSTRSGVSTTAIRSVLTDLLAIAPNTDQLLAKLDLLLFSGQMDATLKSTLATYLNSIPTSSDKGLARLQEALYLSFSSPQYMHQR